MPDRKALLCEWITATLPVLGRKGEAWTLERASDDASFRRYFRVSLDDVSLIAMDAPPENENCHPFQAIATAWRGAGIPVPEVLACDLERGFMLLTDFGNRTYLSYVQDGNADRLYRTAIDTLLDIQQTSPAVPGWPLPPYDKALLRRELGLFREWFCQGWLALELSSAEQALLADVENKLCHQALAQPTVPVHRDYHSRNLMVQADDSLGVLDFQDALLGPVSYDLVSLLRDCYIRWPSERRQQWVTYYLEQARQRGILAESVTQAQFQRWFDWMGMQRHLKATGIFARLWLRDGKSAYLNDIPRTLAYVREVCAKYEEFTAMAAWLEQRIGPTLEARQPLSMEA